MSDSVLDVTSPSLPAAGVGKIATTVVPTPSSPATTPVVKPSIAALVNAAPTKGPKGLSGFKSSDLTSGYFHGILYGETDSRKTSTGAKFGGHEHTLILLTRSPEQMITLRDRPFNIARIEDGEALMWALQYPEKAADSIGFPQWKDDPERVLMVDDMTEGTEMLVDDNKTTDEGKERKDGRQIYKATNSDIRDVLASLKKKKMHLVLTALAKVDVSQIANEETIYPDMPKGARTILTADLEYVFFMKGSTGKMLTKRVYLNYTKKDPTTGKDVVGRREIFAKQKLPDNLIGRTPPIIATEEEMDLRKLWDRIRTAK